MSPMNFMQLTSNTHAHHKNINWNPSGTFLRARPHARRRLLRERAPNREEHLARHDRRRSRRRRQFTAASMHSRVITVKVHRYTRRTGAFASASVHPRRVLTCLVETSRGALLFGTTVPTRARGWVSVHAGVVTIIGHVVRGYATHRWARYFFNFKRIIFIFDGFINIKTFTVHVIIL